MSPSPWGPPHGGEGPKLRCGDLEKVQRGSRHGWFSVLVEPVAEVAEGPWQLHRLLQGYVGPAAPSQPLESADFLLEQ